MTLTGVVLLAANVIFASLRNVHDLVIPFADDKKLEFTKGWCFWLNLITGSYRF